MKLVSMMALFAAATFATSAGAAETCASLRARNARASWSDYQALPPRCAPRRERRLPKVYAKAPTGWSCKNDTFYDERGRAGLDCGPIVQVMAWKYERPCDKDAILISMDRKYCRGSGPGQSHCDDGATVIDIDSQAACSVAISRHVYGARALSARLSGARTPARLNVVNPWVPQ